MRNIIYWHHKVFPYRGRDAEVVNAFRKADWVDAAGGLVQHGLNRSQIATVTAAIPKHGFRRTLQRLAGDLADCRTLRGLAKVMRKVHKW